MPDAVSQIQARRVGSDVYITLVVPAQNLDRSQPAAVARLDIYAVTTSGPPPGEAFTTVAERIASVPVALPPPPPAAGGPQPAPRSDAPTVPAPGASITVRETLDAAALVPKVIAAPVATGRGRRSQSPPAPTLENPPSKPDQADAGAGGAAPPALARRYYMAIGVSDRNRSVGQGTLVSVPAGALPEAPAGVTLTWTQEQLLVSWTAVPGASGYQVYREDRQASTPVPSPPAWEMVAPAPLNGAALSTPSFSEPIEFGRERCFRVRTLRTEAGLVVESEPSPPGACVTPDDHFPPAAPDGLVAQTSTDGIALRWLPNSEADLGGYLVLRGRAGDATLQALTPAPVTQTQYVDRTVTSGVRYVYAIVAVDSHQPVPNRSEPSARDEATAP